METRFVNRLRRITPLVLALAIGLAACGSTTHYELVDATSAYQLVEESPTGLVVLDVRTPQEHAEVRIGGSTLIDFYSPDFQSMLDDLDKQVPYFVYCRSGNRSAETVVLMRDLGFTEVYELEGGIQSWALQGLPLVSS